MLLLFLAPHHVGFLAYLDLYQKEFVQIKLRVRGKGLSGSVSAILQFGLIPENIRKMFFVKLLVHCPGSPDVQQKHSSNVLKN